MTTVNGKSAIESIEFSAGTTLPDYRDELNVSEIPEPIERLRFFCSLTMKGQVWLDIEPFFNDVNNELAQANATIAALQAKLEEEDGQEVVGYVREYGVECLNGTLVNQTTGRTPLPSRTAIDPYALCEKDIPLFTRPPITSERELELLGIIEQMSSLLVSSLHKKDSIQFSEYADKVRTQLALTPDLSGK